VSDNFIDIDIFRGLIILTVDDDKNILVLISYIFKKYGIQVMTADNALSAFKLIQQHRVDLLISDITMPDLDGYWLIQKIRSLGDRQTCSIPAIALTGNTEEQADKKALASGFQAYIQKPSTATQLITQVAKILKKRSLSKSCIVN
jgi:two-component system OmpR family response regulator